MKTLYLVCKLNTTVEYEDKTTGEFTEMPINNAAGVMPVFETREEAEDHAAGKYTILPITAYD